MSRETLQRKQDICRAEFLVAMARGLTRDESARALKVRAAIDGLSVHAAALAVLSAEPTDELVIDRPSELPPPPTHRHLHALRPRAAERSSSSSDDTAPTAPGGRHRRT